MTVTVETIVASSDTQLHCGWTPLWCKWICNSFYKKNENQGQCLKANDPLKSQNNTQGQHCK